MIIKTRTQPAKIHLKLDVNNLAKSLGISEEAVVKEFTDGRVISRFAEHWAARLYNFDKAVNSNQKGYDGVFITPLVNLRIGVRSLTKSGIKFQDSKYIGSGRNCNTENLIESVNSFDVEIVVDIIEFPDIFFLPVDTESILKAIKFGYLTCSGLKRDKFYNIFFDGAQNPIDIIDKSIAVEELKSTY